MAEIDIGGKSHRGHPSICPFRSTARDSKHHGTRGQPASQDMWSPKHISIVWQPRGKWSVQSGGLSLQTIFILAVAPHVVDGVRRLRPRHGQ